MERKISNKQKRVIIIGAGGHGKVIADIINKSGDSVLGFLDDKENIEIARYPYLGPVKNAIEFSTEALFIVAIGDNTTRKKIMNEFTLNWYTAIHPNAVIASDVGIGEGTAIMANAVINSGSKIGKGVIINTSATVDHDCTVSDYVHISPGVHLSGTVNIGEVSWLGIGVVVTNNVDICKFCKIGAGAVVIENITCVGTYVGVPARKVN